MAREWKRRHTPGPWRLCPGRNNVYREAIEADPDGYAAFAHHVYYVCGPKDDSHFVADVIVTGYGSKIAEGEANARLMAAAPLLLDACMTGDGGEPTGTLVSELLELANIIKRGEAVHFSQGFFLESVARRIGRAVGRAIPGA